MFSTQTIDTRLRGHAWIADRLLELASGDGLPAMPGGYLDAEAVWPLLLELRPLGTLGVVLVLSQWYAGRERVKISASESDNGDKR